jgi:hypothetical protein
LSDSVALRYALLAMDALSCTGADEELWRRPRSAKPLPLLLPLPLLCSSAPSDPHSPQRRRRLCRLSSLLHCLLCRRLRRKGAPQAPSLRSSSLGCASSTMRRRCRRRRLAPWLAVPLRALATMAMATATTAAAPSAWMRSPGAHHGADAVRPRAAKVLATAAPACPVCRAAATGTRKA